MVIFFYNMKKNEHYWFMRMMDGNFLWVSMESCATCDSPKGGVVNCITELQEFKDIEHLGSLDKWQDACMLFQEWRDLLFAPFPTADLSIDSSLMFPGFERLSLIPHPRCCARLCVFSSFRILPHKSACLLHCGNSFSLHSLSFDPWFQVMAYWNWEITWSCLEQRANDPFLCVPIFIRSRT